MVKSSKDTRYATDAVVTHDGVRFPCWALPDLSSFEHRIGSNAYEKVDVIGIDEAQFFDDVYGFCCHAADIDRKIVIVAGLDGNFLRNSFGSILRLVPHADSVVKLTARCEVCCNTEKDSNEANGTDWRFRHLHAGHYLQPQPDMEKEEALAKQII